MKQNLTIVLLLFTLNHVIGRDNVIKPTYSFDGTITTDKIQPLKVRMNFFVYPDSSIVGSYYYKHSSGSLKLTGKLNSDNSFFLIERDYEKNITGYFCGLLTPNQRIALGKWLSPESDKVFNFLLSRLEEKSHWEYTWKNRALYEYTNLQLVLKESEKVVSIDVARQDLARLPKGIKRLKNIVSISLLGNNFTSFPTVLSHLTTLDEISLCSNHLKKVGKEIGQLRNLRVLIMNMNELTELPKEIGELTNLLYLDVSMNHIKYLPDEIMYLTNLQELHIYRNDLDEKEKRRIKKLLPNCEITF